MQLRVHFSVCSVAYLFVKRASVTSMQLELSMFCVPTTETSN